ncbi:SprT-like domain-containing protein [Microbacterium sorbitolivorans]|uniref:M48 family peptidase n=1 Tax=Microbacterium sorbitolivorans TaxID=1867410 RepID=A0A367Y1I8_9MICO|nr:SprT-like domain-containing protein [Microbacterium sorbitolivorans]RCK59733.1 M48 family peptidase [Microbacterium sorbitolivorans]
MADLQKVTVWANALIRMHLDPSWTFAFDNAKKRAGACHFTARRITVSRYLAARFADDDIHQTLLHEVAHAIAGPTAGHGPAWKSIARDLGYVGGTTHALETATELAPWVGICPNGHIAYRHRRPSRPSSCAKCSRTFNPALMIRWSRREITPAARRAAATPR